MDQEVNEILKSQSEEGEEPKDYVSRVNTNIYIYIQWCSPNSNCSNSNIALLESYF